MLFNLETISVCGNEKAVTGSENSLAPIPSPRGLLRVGGGAASANEAPSRTILYRVLRRALCHGILSRRISHACNPAAGRLFDGVSTADMRCGRWHIFEKKKKKIMCGLLRARIG